MTKKAKILLLGTFHITYSNDKHTSSLKEEGFDRPAEFTYLNKQLAKFKPNKIAVEVSPRNQLRLNDDYKKYGKIPNDKLEFHGEITFIAYELARLQGIEMLHAINAPLEYDYESIEKLAESISSTIYQDFMGNDAQKLVQHMDYLCRNESVLKIHQYLNSDQALDLLITLNADIMTLVNTTGKYEGADMAAAYYQRNLRIFANLNRLQLQPDDRLFILMGASHIAFLKMLINRSPFYELANIEDFLV